MSGVISVGITGSAYDRDIAREECFEAREVNDGVVGGAANHGSPEMSRAVVTATWFDVPHISEAARKDLLDSIQRMHPHQVDARSKGVPSLGVGAIYPFSEDSIRVDPFPIPRHFKRAFGLDADAGSGSTAIVWGAVDLDANIAYINDCYKSSSRELSLHVDALRQRSMGSAREALTQMRTGGEPKQYEFWIPGVGDAKNLIVTEYDSHQVIELYRGAGVDVEYPDKAVEAGIGQVYEMFVGQRLKVFSTCTHFWQEMRLYRRDKNSRIVKQNDHVLDALRYLVRSGFTRAKMFAEKVKKPKNNLLVVDQGQQGTGWMSALLLPLLSLGALWMC